MTEQEKLKITEVRILLSQMTSSILCMTTNEKNQTLDNYAKNIVKLFSIPVVTKWVAVNERLPSEQTDVITYSKEFEVRNGRCMQKGSWFVNGYSRLVNVTHWAELPKPPCL